MSKLELQVFSVHLSDERVVYMKRPTWEKTFRNGIVIYVNAEMFSKVLVNFDKFRTPDNEHDKKKYSDAEKCLLNSLNNPVPMAEIGRYNEQGTLLSIGAGITRTIWLINNGAKYLPLYCRSSELEIIEKLIEVKISCRDD